MLQSYMRKYGVDLVTASAIYVPILKRGAVDYALAADWTPAAGDVTVCVDGGTVNNIATLPTAVTRGSTARWKFLLAGASELNGKHVEVNICDQTSPKVIEDQAFDIETFGNASAKYPSDPSADNTDAELRFILASQAIAWGRVGSGTNSVTQISISGGQGSISPALTRADQLKGRIITFLRNTTTAGLQTEGAPIDGNSTTQITIASANQLTDAPVEGDLFVVT